ncbi:inverse autotransporter beta domain-containing protein, partial [Salmonella enterica subsp. enterica serovar Infantis]
SDWKDSEDFDFYEERPARGWDIRMESWLPFYPQLGAKLVYEQGFIDFARVHFISALHGSGVGNLFESVREAYDSSTRRVSTAML